MNENKFSPYYQYPYANNAASIYCYKSSRKNAKTSDYITVNHLINNHDFRIVDDNRILNQFINTVDAVASYCKKYDHMELSVHVGTFKQSCMVNANLDYYHKVEDVPYHFHRVKFYSIENVINFLFTIYALIYPYNLLYLPDIYNDSSIKHIIKNFYKKGGEIA